MTPIRRWPSPSRWRVAVRPPFQFVAPIDGVSWSGSPVGSTTTYGMPRVASCSRFVSLKSEKTAITPVGRRARTPSIQPLPGDRRPCISLKHDCEVVLAGDALDATDDLERPLALELVEDHLEERGPRSRAG